ncbi:MAG: small subunit ribosomal protein S6 [Bacillota bacterium]|nr:MAG: small subunit ribosomal protein S6 [Bacillota bacterium]MBS3951047.1 30S ribosomal protein S6 [Peptococcaceae bacterium]
MRKYETMFILNIGLSKEQLPEKVERFTNVITSNGGQVDKFSEWGKRRLAYEVNKQREGYYFLVNFSAEPTVVKELERIFRISEDVVRYLIVRLDD